MGTPEIPNARPDTPDLTNLSPDKAKAINTVQTAATTIEGFKAYFKDDPITTAEITRFVGLFRDHLIEDLTTGRIDGPNLSIPEGPEGALGSAITELLMDKDKPPAITHSGQLASQRTIALYPLILDGYYIAEKPGIRLGSFQREIITKKAAGQLPILPDSSLAKE